MLFLATLYPKTCCSTFHDVYEFAQVFKLIGGADQELLEVVFVILHLEQDVCHGPDHVKSTVFLRRRPVKILE